jgi:hypothetical protein
MTVEEARQIALEPLDSIEGFHHGHPDFRVGKRIFATLWPGQDRSVLRLPLEFAESLETRSPGLYRVVSRLGGQGWLSVNLSGHGASEFRNLVEIAHHHLSAGRPKRLH